MRAKALDKTPTAMLSRAVAGQVKVAGVAFGQLAVLVETVLDGKPKGFRACFPRLAFAAGAHFDDSELFTAARPYAKRASPDCVAMERSERVTRLPIAQLNGLFLCYHGFPFFLVDCYHLPQPVLCQPGN